MSPALEIVSLIPGKTGTLAKGKEPALDAEAVRSLEFVRAIFLMDPAVHVHKYLNLLPTHKSVLWSDASGYEKDTNNPTPGRMASLFTYPYAKSGQIICAYTDWDELLPRIRTQTSELDSEPWYKCESVTRLDLRKDDLTIAYLELSALLLTLLQLMVLCIRHPELLTRFSRKVIILKCDNQNCVAWCASGRVKFMPWNRLLEVIFILEIILENKITVAWVPSERQKADPLSRGVTTVREGSRKFRARKHDRQTLEMFVNALVFGPNLDVLKNISSSRSVRNFTPPTKVSSPQTTMEKPNAFGRTSVDTWTPSRVRLWEKFGILSSTFSKKVKTRIPGERIATLILS